MSSNQVQVGFKKPYNFSFLQMGVQDCWTARDLCESDSWDTSRSQSLSRVPGPSEAKQLAGWQLAPHKKKVAKILSKNMSENKNFLGCKNTKLAGCENKKLAGCENM